MRRSFPIAALFVAVFAFAACSDDSSGNNNTEMDATVEQDASSQMDAETQQDAATEADGASTPWNCSQIGDCASECSGNITCVNRCKENGCTSAKDAFSALMTCVMGSCLTECGAEGNQADCDTCMGEKCSTQMEDCGNNQCE